MLHRGMKASTTAGFLRSVYGSFMLKLLLAAIVVFGYAFLYKEQINKPSLFTCMFLYLVYTFLEIRTLLKISKKSTNA
jgi:FtsH-binding integral membrane protein